MKDLMTKKPASIAGYPSEEAGNQSEKVLFSLVPPLSFDKSLDLSGHILFFTLFF